MQIFGQLYAADSAARSDAVLVINDDQFQLYVNNQLNLTGELSEIKTSDRLGNLERKLNFSDGTVFTTQDNDSIDNTFKTTSSWLHKIESNLAWVSVASVVLIVTIFVVFRWGIPWLGHTVAHSLPTSVGESIGASTLDFLDDSFLSESLLEQDRRESIRSHFSQTLVPKNRIDPEITYTLHFRAWGKGDGAVANALALPSGDIILTDRFVEQAANQDEIDSVLLHEMGHVEHRHTLEMVTQSALMAIVLTVVTGDASGIADLGIGLGSLLVTVGYARNVESEADAFAFKQMLRSNIDPIAFANIMSKISGHTKNDGSNSIEVSSGKESNRTSIMDYLSTHPLTEQRINEAKRFSTCFHKGDLKCVAPVPVQNAQ